MAAIEEVYIVGDQPTTCPICGARTNFTEVKNDDHEIRQHHFCLNNECNNEFAVM